MMEIRRLSSYLERPRVPSRLEAWRNCQPYREWAVKVIIRVMFDLGCSAQVTVGDPKRARTIAASFDTSPKPFELLSERGFLTITGTVRFPHDTLHVFDCLSL
jgi:hypothetical protein